MIDQKWSKDFENYSDVWGRGVKISVTNYAIAWIVAEINEKGAAWINTQNTVADQTLRSASCSQ